MTDHGSLLHQLPNIVLVNIMEQLDFRSMTTLRRVCRDLHDFIDEARPMSCVTEMTIKIDRKRGIMKIVDSNLGNQKPIRINYRWNVYNKKVKATLTEEDVYNDLCNVFTDILRHQKTKVLEKFSLHIDHNTGDFMEKFQTILKSCNSPFPSKTLIIEMHGQNQVIPVLSLIESKYLEKIEVYKGIQDEREFLEISILDQWKNAKELKIQGAFVSAPFQCFNHFSKVSITVHEVTLEMLRSLKEMFLNNPSMHRFEIFTNVSYHVIQINELFGNPYDGQVKVKKNEEKERVDVRWLHRIPGNNKDAIEIRSNCFSRFTVLRIKMADVPEDAVLGK